MITALKERFRRSGFCATFARDNTEARMTLCPEVRAWRVDIGDDFSRLGSVSPSGELEDVHEILIAARFHCAERGLMSCFDAVEDFVRTTERQSAPLR